MEGAGHRRRWNKKALVGTLLLLMCMLIPAVALVQDCPVGDYLTEDRICCNKCPPGFKLVEKCHARGQRSNCTHCGDGEYMDQMNFYPNCRRCKRCNKPYEVTFSKCAIDRNTICHCKTGYYKSKIDSETSQCLKCTPCGPDEKETSMCTPENNTVCGCKENFHRVNGKCIPCDTCTAECKEKCLSTRPPSLNTKGPEHDSGFLVNVIVGVVVALVALLLLGIFITYKMTKRSTKRKLLSLNSQTSDVSQDSCKQILISTVGDSEKTSVEATAHSSVVEVELAKLPDCIPLEIKIPDLIYTVLDQVPVLQMKQLVRSLGVKDTEIEQAEMDHRSCREAHYQMLRMWAERGMRAGGGGQGGMLHQPLLQELLDKLRAMHLKRAADELENKYGVQ